MNTIYKYLDIFDDDFFKNPTMKISVPRYFNDPFESAICDEINEILSIYLKTIYPENTQKANKYYSIAKSYIDNKMSENGVISLTRNNAEILMWSHYANNHKGMCIGLEDDFATHKVNGDMFQHEIEWLTPTPVEYHKNRFNPKSKISENFVYDLYRALTLNKYDKWRYEEEERIVIPTHCADKIIIKKTDIPRSITLPNGQHFNFSTSAWVPKMIKENLLTEIYENGKQYYIKNKSNETLFSILTMCLGMFEEATFLMSIPTDKIKSVHFGCNTPESKIKHITEQLKDPANNLQHVKTYKYTLSTEKFELIPIEINSQ